MKKILFIALFMFAVVACKKEEKEVLPSEIVPVTNPTGVYKGGFAKLDTAGYIPVGSQAMSFSVTHSGNTINIKQLIRANNFDFSGVYDILKNDTEGYWFSDQYYIFLFSNRIELRQCSDIYNSCTLVLWKQ